MSKILIADIETTHTSRFKGHIVEVGIVGLDLITGNRQILFDSVCHEDGMTLSEVENSWIIKNSTLSAAAIKYSKNLKTLFPYIQQIFSNPEYIGITAYNNVFDFYWLENRGFKLGNKLDCPMLLTQKVWNGTETKEKHKRPNMMEAYEFLTGNPIVELHRGGDDAYQEATIVHKLHTDYNFYQYE